MSIQQNQSVLATQNVFAQSHGSRPFNLFFQYDYAESQRIFVQKYPSAVLRGLGGLEGWEWFIDQTGENHFKPGNSIFWSSLTWVCRHSQYPTWLLRQKLGHSKTPRHIACNRPWSMSNSQVRRDGLHLRYVTSWYGSISSRPSVARETTSL